MQSPDARVVALCDLASDRISAAQNEVGGQAAGYTDFRESVRTRKPSAVGAGFATEASKIAGAVDRSIVERWPVEGELA